jgi:hypothetical protein
LGLLWGGSLRRGSRLLLSSSGSEDGTIRANGLGTLFVHGNSDKLCLSGGGRIVDRLRSCVPIVLHLLVIAMMGRAFL